jgi:hypothetical protein
MDTRVIAEEQKNSEFKKFKNQSKWKDYHW